MRLKPLGHPSGVELLRPGQAGFKLAKLTEAANSCNAVGGRCPHAGFSILRKCVGVAWAFLLGLDTSWRRAAGEFGRGGYLEGPQESQNKMVVARIFGIVLILVGLAVAGRDVIASISSGGLDIVSLGALWFRIDAGSLNGLQAGVERYVAVWLWDSVLEPMLHWPALFFPLVPGILLLAMSLRRRDSGGGLGRRRSRKRRS